MAIPVRQPEVKAPRSDLRPLSATIKTLAKKKNVAVTGEEVRRIAREIGARVEKIDGTLMVGPDALRDVWHELGRRRNAR